MPLPTSYTEESLAQFMHTTLGTIATDLELEEPAGELGAYAEAVYEALFNYGASDIATITGTYNVRRLRVLAEVEAWRLVVYLTSGDFDFSADGGSYKRSQINAQARESLKMVEAKAVQLGANTDYAVGIDRLDHIHDPYIYRDEEDQVVP